MNKTWRESGDQPGFTQQLPVVNCVSWGVGVAVGVRVGRGVEVGRGVAVGVAVGAGVGVAATGGLAGGSVRAHATSSRLCRKSAITVLIFIFADTNQAARLPGSC